MPIIIQLAPNELLEGKTVLIAGGTSGIVFSITWAFLSLVLGNTFVTAQLTTVNIKRCQVIITLWGVCFFLLHGLHSKWAV